MTHLFDRLREKKSENVQLKSSGSLPSPPTQKMHLIPKSITATSFSRKKKFYKYTKRSITEPSIHQKSFDTSLTSTADINILFEQMLERRGIYDQQMRESMQLWDINKKRLMVCQDQQAQQLTLSRHDTSSYHPTPYSHYPMEASGNAYAAVLEVANPWSVSSGRAQTTVESGQGLSIPGVEIKHKSIPEAAEPPATNLNSPVYFVQMLETQQRTVSPTSVARLEVNLRTQSINWVGQFIDLKGFHGLANALESMHRKGTRIEEDDDIEIEIVKCFKAILSTNSGAQEVISYPNHIYPIVFSLASSHWQIRKLACELLTFVCFRYDRGYRDILDGFELVKIYHHEANPFDLWLKGFEAVISECGRRPSLISRREEQTMTKDPKTPNNHLMEYVVSNMIFINALTNTPKDIHTRVYIRKQLNASGMQTSILPMIKYLKHHVLSFQIETYRISFENDLQEMHGDTASLHSNLLGPYELLDHVVKSIKDIPQAMESIQAILYSMLLIKGDSTTKAYYFNTMSVLISQTVTDSSSETSSSDFSTTPGTPTGERIHKYIDGNILQIVESELISIKQKLLSVVDEKNNPRNRLEPPQVPVHSENDSIHTDGPKMEQENPILKINDQIQHIKTILQEHSLSTDPSRDLSKNSSINDSVHISQEISIINLDSSIDEKKNRYQNLTKDNNAVSTTFTSFSAPLLTPPPPPPPPPPPINYKTLSNETNCSSRLKDCTLSVSNNDESKCSKVNVFASIPDTSNLLRKQTACLPTIKLKHLQWKKLEVHQIQNTVWADDSFEEDKLEKALHQTGLFDTLEQLFPAYASTTSEKMQTKMKNEKQETKKAQFLSYEKRQKIDIAILSKIKHIPSFQHVYQGILTFDQALCTERFLGNLIACLPNKSDDLKAIETYMKKSEEECNVLDIPERFIITMLRMYRFENRVRFMLLKVQFWERYEHLMQSMKLITNVSDSLRCSKSMKELLHIILIVGNYMNALSFQGGAFGVKIESLSKLVDTKVSKTSGLSLLHILVGVVRQQFPHLLDFVDDIKNTRQAAHVLESAQDLMQQHKDLCQGLKDLYQELEEHWAGMHLLQHDKFTDIMREHYDIALPHVGHLQEAYLCMNTSWKEAMAYYGENDKDMRPENFFNIFASFLNSWKEAVTVEENQTKAKCWENGNNPEVRKRLKNKTYKEGTKDLYFDDMEDDRKVMDNLQRTATQFYLSIVILS
ncbi:hypothetical protein BDF14DRAFT_1754945 [Spinellus fusiger]|nr:hypothetical protein BDF14DRAFT_1754945 [Spinellus fusiger]